MRAVRSALLSSPEPRELTAEEYLQAKLNYEAACHVVAAELRRSPCRIVLLDVRDAPGYEKSHIRGARNIPEKGLPSKMAALPRMKTIITYGWDGDCALAPKAAFALARSGYKAKILAGGLAEWLRRDLPVDKKVEMRRH